ncbi:MAG: rhodanese-like domain-containing protein [Chloroflexi bacterium]|nr:rhodanese-like domain-containing protein [Chloroflexota bacterium]
MSTTRPRTVAELVSAAKQRIENLSSDQFAAELARGQTLIVDVREPDERNQNGAIRGAVHAPRGMLEFYADPASPYHRQEFDPARRTLLYCASGGRSALAVQALQQLGYTNIAHLDGGLKAWAAGGRGLTRA